MNTSERWFGVCTERGAFWNHDGNPRRPHVILGSGMHSIAFCRSEHLMDDPLLFAEAVNDHLDMLIAEGLDIEIVDRVVGPALSGMTFAHEMARAISHRRGRSCLKAYAEKRDETTKEMVFNRCRISARERVLIVDDVLTTGRAFGRVADLVIAAGSHVLPFAGVLINRSGMHECKGRKIVGLVARVLPKWEPAACPWCVQGSGALLPKDPSTDNWPLLSGQY